MLRRAADAALRASVDCWLRGRVWLFVQSAACRHDGSSPRCLWCGIAATSAHPLGLDVPAHTR